MLDVIDLGKKFGGLPVLEHLNLRVEPKEITAIVGPSGCGKSTLLNLIAGITGDYEGQIRNRAKKTGYVFQEDRILPWLTVYDNIRVVRDDTDEARIAQLIDQVHLTGFEDYYPEQLSGGMRQRCGIARAFYYGSELLLMDEPFGALDAVTRARLQDLVRELWTRDEKKKTVFFVTHDVDEALLLANRILVLGQSPSHIIYDVKITEELHPTRDTLFENIDMMKLRITLINQINKDVTTHI